MYMILPILNITIQIQRLQLDSYELLMSIFSHVVFWLPRDRERLLCGVGGVHGVCWPISRKVNDYLMGI